MKKLCVLTSIVSVLLACGVHLAAAGTTRFLAETGVDLGDCSDPANPCASLRYAIAAASSQDTVKLAAGVYTEAKIVIKKSLVLTGMGAEQTVVQAAEEPFAKQGGVFRVHKGAVVRIERMTIRHGDVNGDIGGGGGISNGGSLTLVHAVVSDNRVRDFKETSGHIESHGGGIYNSGSLVVSHTVVRDNVSSHGLDDGGDGGGIYNYLDGDVRIYRSTLQGNRAGMAYEGPGGRGGGLSNYGTAMIEESAVVNNHGGDGGERGGEGGGVSNSGTMTIRSSTISGNRSGNGLENFYGGYDEDDFWGEGGDGGGIRNGWKLVVESSTIANNHAGGVVLAGEGKAGSGGGISSVSRPGFLTLFNTMVISNAVESFPDGRSGEAPDCQGHVVSLGYNLIGDAEGCILEGELETTLTDVEDGLLGPLQDNGGPTVTHALLLGSPAVNAGDPAFLPPPETDQRGFPRVSAGRIDIGAYELVAQPFVAYNDLSWVDGQLSRNITLYTTDHGVGTPPEGSHGQLVDYQTGVFVSAMLTVEGGNWNGGNHTKQGSLSEIGTDGHKVFSGKVDAQGVISYSAEELKLTLSDLAPSLRYEVILYGNRDRNAPAYDERITKTTLNGVVHLENRSTEGADFAGGNDESCVIANGYNRENGFVARFANIDPGADGKFVLTVADDGSPDSPKFYANALCLKASPKGREYIASIGFSNSADGDMDVTEYLQDEMLYVTVKDLELDAELEASTKVEVKLSQGIVELTELLPFDAETNAFAGDLELASFSTGEVSVVISGMVGAEEILRRDSSIFIVGE